MPIPEDYPQPYIVECGGIQPPFSPTGQPQKERPRRTPKGTPMSRAFGQEQETVDELPERQA